MNKINQVVLSDGQKYIEITHTEYRRLKRDNPKDVNSYTARVRFKYFKLIQKEIKLDILEIVARKTAEIITEINKLEINDTQIQYNEIYNKAKEEVNEILDKSVEDFDDLDRIEKLKEKIKKNYLEKR